MLLMKDQPYCGVLVVDADAVLSFLCFFASATDLLLLMCCFALLTIPPLVVVVPLVGIQQFLVC